MSFNFPIKQDITVLPADDPKKLKLGWVIYEDITPELEKEIYLEGFAKGKLTKEKLEEALKKIKEEDTFKKLDPPVYKKDDFQLKDLSMDLKKTMTDQAKKNIQYEEDKKIFEAINSVVGETQKDLQFDLFALHGIDITNEMQKVQEDKQKKEEEEKGEVLHVFK